MAHLDLDFPRDVAAGCQATLERRDEVVLLASGREETNQRWAHARRSYAAGLGVRSAADLAAVVALFEEARGRANSFRFRDWLDWRSAPAAAAITPTDQPLGFGDGTLRAFQVTRQYGTVNPYFRPIALPVPASLRIAVNGIEVPGGWSLSGTGGLVTFPTAPAPGSVLTAGYLFDVPVRFESGMLSVNWSYFNERGGVGSAPDVPLVEVRLDAA